MLLSTNGPEGLAELASDIAADVRARTPPRSAPEPPSPSHRAELVAANAQKLLESLPPRSPTRRELAEELVDGLPTKEAAAFAGCSERTIQRARREKQDAKTNGHLFVKHKMKTKRPKISVEEKKATERWLGEKCPVKSGTKYHIQRCTSMSLYEAYRASIDKGELSWKRADKDDGAVVIKPRSRGVFDAMKRKMGIRAAKGYDGNFDCLLCKAIPEEVKNQAVLQSQWEAAVAKNDGTAGQLHVDLEAAKTRVTKLREHEALRLHQAAYLKHVRYVATRKDLTRALIVMDFSKFNTLPPVGDSGAIEWIHDLVMVLEWWQTEEQAEAKEQKKSESKDEKAEGRKPRKKQKKQSTKEEQVHEPERQQLFIDNLCDSPGIEKNDVAYVKAALRRLIAGGHLDGFHRIDLFTDGGGKHFKNVYAMELMASWVDMWHELRGKNARVPVIYWTVTAPYHGQGSADGHAGVISRALRREQIASQDKGTETTRPASADALAAMIEEKLTSVVPEVFRSITRPEFRSDLESLAGGIKQFFQFSFVRTYTITTSESESRC